MSINNPINQLNFSIDIDSHGQFPYSFKTYVKKLLKVSLYL